MDYLFRGKPIHGGNYVEGDLIQLLGKQGQGRKFIVNNRFGACIDEEGNFINTQFPYVMEVDPSTVGQYSKIDLKDGTELFDGDIVQHETVNWIGVVEFKDGAFRVTAKHDSWHLNKLRAERLVKVGTVHDNPELLK